MIALDTNVVVRYIMQDDAKQSPMANQLMESLTPEACGYVTLVSVVELVWVLGSSYGLERAQIVAALESLIRTKELVVEQAERVWKAVRTYRDTSADFADALIMASSTDAGCLQTMTFDRGAARQCGMTLIR